MESYQLAFYKAGKRKRERTSGLEAARNRGKELVEELATGTGHVDTFTPRQTAMINEVVEMLKPLNVPLTEAVRQSAEAHTQLAGKGSILEAVKCFLAESRKVQLKSIKVVALVEKFPADLREKEKSRRCILDMQARLHKAAETFTGYVGEIHAEQIDRWLSLMKETSGRTKNNYRAALATLFSFARQKGHLPRRQQTEAEFSTRCNGKGGEIGTYAAKQLQVLLSRIEPRMIPLVAIGAFAGLRSAEIVRLEW